MARGSHQVSPRKIVSSSQRVESTMEVPHDMDVAMESIEGFRELEDIQMMSRRDTEFTSILRKTTSTTESSEKREQIVSTPSMQFEIDSKKRASVVVQSTQERREKSVASLTQMEIDVSDKQAKSIQDIIPKPVHKQQIEILKPEKKLETIRHEETDQRISIDKRTRMAQEKVIDESKSDWRFSKSQSLKY